MANFKHLLYTIKRVAWRRSEVFTSGLSCFDQFIQECAEMDIIYLVLVYQSLQVAAELSLGLRRRNILFLVCPIKGYRVSTSCLNFSLRICTLQPIWLHRSCTSLSPGSLDLIFTIIIQERKLHHLILNFSHSPSVSPSFWVMSRYTTLLEVQSPSPFLAFSESFSPSYYYSQIWFPVRAINTAQLIVGARKVIVLFLFSAFQFIYLFIHFSIF